MASSSRRGDLRSILNASTQKKGVVVDYSHSSSKDRMQSEMERNKIIPMSENGMTVDRGFFAQSRQPQAPRRYYCDVCNYSAEVMAFEIHLTSSLHKNREEQWYQTFCRVQKPAFAEDGSTESFTFNCELCQIGFSSGRELESHHHSLEHLLVQQGKVELDSGRSRLNGPTGPMCEAPKRSSFVCGVCMKMCGSAAALEKHVNSDQHRRRVQATMNDQRQRRDNYGYRAKMEPRMLNGPVSSSYANNLYQDTNNSSRFLMEKGYLHSAAISEMPFQAIDHPSTSSGECYFPPLPQLEAPVAPPLPPPPSMVTPRDAAISSYWNPKPTYQAPQPVVVTKEEKVAAMDVVYDYQHGTPQVTAPIVLGGETAPIVLAGEKEPPALNQGPHQGWHQGPNQEPHQGWHQGPHQEPHQGWHQGPHQGPHHGLRQPSNVVEYKHSSPSLSVPKDPRLMKHLLKPTNDSNNKIISSVSAPKPVEAPTPVLTEVPEFNLSTIIVPNPEEIAVDEFEESALVIDESVNTTSENAEDAVNRSSEADSLVSINDADVEFDLEEDQQRQANDDLITQELEDEILGDISVD